MYIGVVVAVPLSSSDTSDIREAGICKCYSVPSMHPLRIRSQVNQIYAPNHPLTLSRAR